MRRVWQRVLVVLGAVAVIWGIVALFSTAWHALIAFGAAVVFFVIARLIPAEAEAPSVPKAPAAQTRSTPPRQPIHIPRPPEEAVADVTPVAESSAPSDGAPSQALEASLDGEVPSVTEAETLGDDADEASTNLGAEDDDSNASDDDDEERDDPPAGNSQ